MSTTACLKLADPSRCCCRLLWRSACPADWLSLLVLHDRPEPPSPLHSLPPSSPCSHEGRPWPGTVCHDALSFLHSCAVSHPCAYTGNAGPCPTMQRVCFAVMLRCAAQVVNRNCILLHLYNATTPAAASRLSVVTCSWLC